MAVRLQLGCGGGQFASTVPRLIQQQPATSEQLLEFRKSRPHLFGFELQQTFASLGCISSGFEIGRRLHQLLVLGLPLQFLRGSAFDLRTERVNTLVHLRKQRLNSLQHSGRRAVAFFERGDTGRVLRRGLRRLFPLLTQPRQRLLSRNNLLLQVHALEFQNLDLRLSCAQNSFLFGTFR